MYQFRYRWRGGRDDGHGLLWMPGGGEHDTYDGAPLAKDVYAYQHGNGSGFTDGVAFEWSTINTQLPGNGTGGQFNRPLTGSTWDAFWNPSAFTAAVGDVLAFAEDVNWWRNAETLQGSA